MIDNTGSTTFVLFDWVVSQAVGRSAQSYLDAMSEATTAAECPQDLKMFVDKRMLFKVEVSDANLYHNWRGYTVKKMTMNDRIIKQIIDLHGISLAHEEEEDAYVETHCELADQKPLETVEGVDSSNKDDVDGVESDATPTSKTLGKAVDVSVQSLDDIVLGGCDGLSTKGPKIVPASSAKGLKLVSDGNAKGSKLVSDSNVMDEGSAKDLIVTQTKNPLGKRAVDSVVPVIDVDVGDSVASTAKEPKLVCVKVEVDE